MKVLKEESKIVQKIRNLEDFLRDNNIEITFRHDGLLLTVDGEEIVIREGESADLEQVLPSFFDGTRFQLLKHYIYGE